MTNAMKRSSCASARQESLKTSLKFSLKANVKVSLVASAFLMSALGRAAEPTPADLALRKGNAEFSLKMYKELSTEQGNLVYSPYSISQALALTYAGARGNTELEIRNALQFLLPQNQLHNTFGMLQKQLGDRMKAPATAGGDPDFILKSANVLWTASDFKLKKEFVDLVTSNYGAGIKTENFAQDAEGARERINKWVSDQTQQKIPGLFGQGQITADSRMVLANAVYFKGTWAHKFSQGFTGDADFTLNNGNIVQAKTMRLALPTRLPYLQGENFSAVSLPYKAPGFSMIVVMPNAKSFASFENTLNLELLQTITTGLAPQMVNLSLPKFKFETSKGLVTPLTNLGMTDAFSDRADFSGIAEDESVRVSAVVHKALIAVDENGTEAAAATGVKFSPTSIITPYVEMKVDKPFFFVIRDENSGALLFAGRVQDPRL